MNYHEPKGIGGFTLTNINNGESNQIIGGKLELWDQVLIETDREIPRPSFEIWFKSILAVKLDKQHIYVICNNSFRLDWPVTHYKEIILTILERGTVDSFEVEFAVVR